MRLGIIIIDKIRGTEVLKKYDELIRATSKNIPFDSIINNNLIKLMLTLKDNNNYYRPLLKNFSKESIIANPLEVLKSMPVTNKQTITNNYKLIYSPIKNRSTQKKKTGGSTGSPFYYLVDKEYISWSWAHIYYFWNKYSGYKPGDPFITIAGNSLRTIGRKIPEAIYHNLQNNYFIKGDIIEANLRIDYNHLKKASLIYGYPSSILSILKSKPELSKSLNNLKAIFTTSEQLLPKTRQSIESAFKLPVYDMYGANDGGILTCECPNHNGYHINVTNCYVENFENEFKMQELLLTNLCSYSLPFVRYRVGDLGTLDYSPCSCGLHWPRIVDLKGRTRDMIKLQDGTSIHGSIFNSIFYKYPHVDGYKIIQEVDYSITIYIHVSDTDYFDNISDQIISEAHYLMRNLTIRCKKMTEMNPTNVKFKLIESHVI